MYLDDTEPSKKRIIFIQSFFRGYLIRKELYNNKQTKEVSIDYSTEQFENNSMITRLNHLLPKFKFEKVDSFHKIKIGIIELQNPPF